MADKEELKFRKHVSAIIESRKDDLGLSYADIARRCSVHQSQINRTVQRVITPSAFLLLKISHAIEIEMNVFDDQSKFVES